MKFTYLRLKGYTRIFNGLGINEIIINLSKCKNKIVLIHGGNGRGKTSIMDTISFFPDAPSEFMNNIIGEKEICAVDNGNVYRAVITSGISSSGSRTQTKALFQKNGEELNPNGNITSYKEVISNEFNMDSNFISLSCLSSLNRGFGDKTPSERKKFVSVYLSSLEAYNNINKTLVKRSSVFSSHINSISNKIQNIGDEETLRVNLQSIETRWSQLTSQRDVLLEKLTKAKTNIEILDPDSKIMNLYNSIFEELGTMDSSMKGFKDKLERLSSEKINIDEIENLINESNISLNTHINILNSLVEKSNTLLSERATLSEELEKNQAKILSMEFHVYDEILKNKTKYESIVAEQEAIFFKLNIKDFNIDKDTLLNGLNLLNHIKKMIMVLRTTFERELIEDVCIGYLSNKDFVSEYTSLLDAKSNLHDQLSENISEITKYTGIKEDADLLLSRPKNCKSDDCFFIQKSIRASKEKPDEVLENLYNAGKAIEQLQETNKIMIEISEKKCNIYNELTDIIKFINDNKSIIEKLPTSSNIININLFVDCLKNGYPFDEIEDSDKFIQYADAINDYKHNKELLSNYTSDYEKLKSKEEVYNIINENIENCNKKLEKVTSELKLVQNDIEFRNELISKETEKNNTLKNIFQYNSEYTQMKEKKQNLKDQYINIKENIMKIDKFMQEKVHIEELINNIDLELNPLVNDRDRLKYSIIQLEDYKAELKNYKDKFEIVELLKKLSSPSKGIQTLFMKLYMGKTLKLTNQLLELFFNGEIQLIDYIINENEFRIPCIISGLERDDIHSCSNAQTSMISMIMSFVLMNQASDKYNIIRLDEIDGSLDHANRNKFVFVLNELIDVLGIEQVFIISHSEELDNINTDNICLSGTDGVLGNVVFDFDEFIKR